METKNRVLLVAVTFTILIGTCVRNAYSGLTTANEMTTPLYFASSLLISNLWAMTGMLVMGMAYISLWLVLE